jgi:hypothetical protein
LDGVFLIKGGKKMTKATKAIGKWGFVGLVIVGLTYVFVHKTLSQDDQTRVPFIARYTETDTDPRTGRSAQRQQLFVAIRSDGSTSLGSFDQRYGWRRITNRAAKVQITVADNLKLKTTYDYSYIPFTSTHHVFPADCRPPEHSSLGVEMVNGHEAYHYQAINVLSRGERIQSDVWLAPDLNCYELKHTVQRYNASDVLDNVFEKDVTELTLGEPPSTLFAIPEDYVEVKDSEREKASFLQNVADREGRDAAAQYVIPPGVQQYWEQLDKRYESVKAKQFNPLKK